MALTYPLQALLSVRWYREDAAKSAARTADRLVTEARELEQKRRAELEEYRSWWPQEVDRRYDAIMGENLNLADLDRFKEGLAALADGELNCQMAVVNAQREVEAREAEAAKAREAVALARREAAKIEAHRDIWQAEARKEAERQEDLELEEFHPPHRESDDE